MNVALQGRYRLLVHDGDTVRYTSPWFDNLITDAGMDRVAQGFWFTTCFVGSGIAEPLYADTQLAHYEDETDITESAFGSSSSNFGSSSSSGNVFSDVLNVPPYYGFIRVHYYFPVGALDKVNVSEVGVGWLTDSSSDSSSSSGYRLFSHALVTNSLDEPQPVKVYEFEQLEVQYELRLYPRLEDYIYTQELAGITSTCVARAAQVTDPLYWAINRTPVDLTAALYVYDGVGAPASSSDEEPAAVALGSIFGLPYGASAEGIVAETLSYQPGSHFLDFMVEWGSTSANFAGGVQAVSFQTYGLGSFQVGIDPPIAKTSAGFLRLQLRVLWYRLDESSSGWAESSSSL